MTDPLAAGEQTVRELLGFEVDVALDLLEPFHPIAGGALQLERLDLADILVARECRRITSFGISPACSESTPARAIASSMASFVPDPILKCAVWAASPISTMLPWYHCSQSTRLNLSQADDPRRWWAFETSGWPSRRSANNVRRARSTERVHRLDARRAPVAFRRLDDERRPVVIEAVGVEVEPPPLRLPEVERERVELDAGCRAR